MTCRDGQAELIGPRHEPRSHSADEGRVEKDSPNGGSRCAILQSLYFQGIQGDIRSVLRLEWIEDDTDLSQPRGNSWPIGIRLLIACVSPLVAVFLGDCSVRMVFTLPSFVPTRLSQVENRKILRRPASRRPASPTPTLGRQRICRGSATTAGAPWRLPALS